MGKIVYTGATFDLIHNGHIRFLKACRRVAGDDGVVVVSLNTDAFIQAYKGKSPIMSFDERKEILLGCRFVDAVIPNIAGADSKPTILQVDPDFVVIGDDWARKDYYAQMQFTQAWLDIQDIQLVYVHYTKGISTTELKSRIMGKQIN